MGKLTTQKTYQGWGWVSHRYKILQKDTCFVTLENRKVKKQSAQARTNEKEITVYFIHWLTLNCIVQSNGILKRDIFVWLKNETLLYHWRICVVLCMHTTHTCIHTTHRYPHTMHSQISSVISTKSSSHQRIFQIYRLQLAMLILLSGGNSSPNNCCARIKC